MNVDFLLQATKEELPLQRFEHTCRVLDTALELARHEPIEENKICVAAVLHDYCKYWSPEILESWIRQTEIPNDLLHYPSLLWHAFVGAEVAKQRFKIDDPDVLNAIRYHTTGRVGMSLLEKVIFLADVIEPGRKFPGVDHLRKLARSHLDQAVLASLDQTIHHLLDRGQKVYPLTLSARNAMLDIVSSETTKEE